MAGQIRKGTNLILMSSLNVTPTSATQQGPSRVCKLEVQDEEEYLF